MRISEVSLMKYDPTAGVYLSRMVAVIENSTCSVTASTSALAVKLTATEVDYLSEKHLRELRSKLADMIMARLFKGFH